MAKELHKPNAKETKMILKFLKENPELSSQMVAKRLQRSRECLAQLLLKNGIYDQRFAPPRMGDKRRNNKPAVTHALKKPNAYPLTLQDANVVYDKVTHQQLVTAILIADTMAMKFINDLNSIDIGAALLIKKENWTIKNHPAFYFKKITTSTKVKVKVKEIGDSYYIVKL